ncbi:MAG: ferritin-like domain-containing protein [Thermoleophilaceae bacterium]
MTGESSRRELLRAAAVTAGGGSAALLAACGGGGGSKPPKIDAEADATVLNQALLAEYAAVAAYRAGRAHVSGRDRALLDKLLAQEQQHVAALTRAIRDLGGRPLHPQPADAVEVPARGVMPFAVDVEHTETAGLADAIGKLTTPQLRGLVASIFADDAQHLALVRRATGQQPIPDALVEGNAPAES